MDKLISFSLPLMLSGILQLMFNAVDIIVVGARSGGFDNGTDQCVYQSVYWYLTWCECTCCPVLCGRKRPGKTGESDKNVNFLDTGGDCEYNTNV